MYDKENNVEAILREDIREKKKAGSGVFSRASRRGYTGTVRTQVDFLKGKEKKEYMKNGECIVVGNIYDDINNVPSLEELRAMDKDKAKTIITYVRKKHKMKQLVSHWGFSDNYLYRKFFPEFDIDTKAYHTKGGRALDTTKPVAPVENNSSITTDVFEINFLKSNVKGKTIQDRVADYLSVLEEEGSYEIVFIVKERR